MGFNTAFDGLKLHELSEQWIKDSVTWVATKFEQKDTCICIENSRGKNTMGYLTL
jgi:hypothetical protein